MKKLLLLIIVLLAASASAKVLNERTLGSLGYEDFAVSGANNQECKTYNFASDQNFDKNNVFTVFSLNTEFKPEKAFTEKSVLQIFLKSEEALKEYFPKDFETDWKRIVLPRKMLSLDNMLKVCANTSSSVTGITVSKESIIGSYEMPYIEIKKTVEEKYPVFGREVEVKISVKNIGSESTDLNVSYPESEKRIAGTTKGNAEFSGVIEAGEEVLLSYFVKPNFAVQMTLPPALAQYTNVFGEKETIQSNRETIFVKEPEFKVKAFILTEKAKYGLGEKVNAQIVVRNEGKNDLENIAIYLRFPKQLAIEKPGLGTVELKAGETKTINIETTSNEEGKYILGCKVIYVDLNTIYTDCEEKLLEFGQEEPNIAILFGFALLIVAAGIYAVLFFTGKKK